MNAVQIKNGIMASVAAVGACIANAFGGMDRLFGLLVCMMVVDYLTGILIAMFWHKSNKSEDGTLDSRAGFKGLCRKGGIFLLVLIAHRLDVALGMSYARTTVILFFIGNEGLSLLENFGIMGVPYPDYMKNMLHALRDQGDKGEEYTGIGKQKNEGDDNNGNGKSVQ